MRTFQLNKLSIYGGLTPHPEEVQKCSTSKEADNTSESDDDSLLALTLDDWDSWFKGDTDSDSSDIE